jgi:hypothetical protein
MEKTTKFTSQYLFVTFKWMKPKKFTSHGCLFSHWNGWIHKVYITGVPFCHIEIDESRKFYITHVCLSVTLTQMKSQSLHHMCIFITWKWTNSQSLHNTHIFITWKRTKSQSFHHTFSFYIIKMDETTKFTSQISWTVTHNHRKNHVLLL